ncbi:hypothetical protein FB451DRAFT_1119384 [Mycena latifolia]|nr:hypothetical protein FB451DRAFT_1119384 [Mycena latifolia]
MSSFTFSNNLVEVGALTALVGSSLAESLILGNRGAAGMAWAAASSFGTISIVKACLSGASSGWLRESLGIRSTASDEALGLELPQDSIRAGKLRRNLEEPLAIFCRGTRDVKGKTRKGAWTDVYAMEYSTSLMIRGIPETQVGSPTQVFAYANYIFYRHRYNLFQIPALLLSAAKVTEVYVLWTHGTAVLGIISAMPWMYFFIGAIVIQAREILLSTKREPELGDLDIVVGQLPMVSRRGGTRKIILGASEDPRVSSPWCVFWAGGAAVSAASIVLAYIFMAQEPRGTIFVWAGFQLLWLGARILVYHLAEPANPMLQRLCATRPYEALPPALKARVVDLAFALGKSQTAIHPRGQAQYAEDAFSVSALRLVRVSAAPGDVYPLPAIHPPQIQVDITAVLGDTVLSSAMWMAGAHETPMDLYDCCVIVFTLPTSHRTVAVPAARVLSGATSRPADRDAERGVPVFVPKGAPNTGAGLTWWYWVPCAEGLWLELQVPVSPGVSLLEAHQAAVRTDAQVSARLALGKLNIGLKDIEDVKGIVELSRNARDSFLALLE